MSQAFSGGGYPLASDLRNAVLADADDDARFSGAQRGNVRLV